MGDRAWLAVSLDGELVRTLTLERFLEENEGAPNVCAVAKALKLGGRALMMEGGFNVERVEPRVRMPSRWVRLSIPWNFDGSKVATVAIHRDTGAISFRPRGRRRVSFVALGALLAQVASKEAKLAALAKRKARRSRR